MTNKKKNFKQDIAADFLGIPTEQEDAKAEPVEVGVERVELPEGFILRPEPKTEHMHLLMQKSIKAALKREATEKGISANELLHRILTERYRK